MKLKEGKSYKTKDKNKLLVQIVQIGGKIPRGWNENEYLDKDHSKWAFCKVTNNEGKVLNVILGLSYLQEILVKEAT